MNHWRSQDWMAWWLGLAATLLVCLLFGAMRDSSGVIVSFLMAAAVSEIAGEASSMSRSDWE